MEASGLFVKNTGCFDVGVYSEENGRFWFFLLQGWPDLMEMQEKDFKALETVCKQSLDFMHFVPIVLSHSKMCCHILLILHFSMKQWVREGG